MFTLMCFTVIACVTKFFFEGVSVTIGEHVYSLGHADAALYASILAPVLGAHGYLDVKNNSERRKVNEKVDNPDDN